MWAALVIVLLALGCTDPTPWPDTGPCAGSLPALGDGSERTVTFPPHDFVCAGGDVALCETRVPLRSDRSRTVVVRNELGGVRVVYLLDSLSIPEATPDPDFDGPLRHRAVGFDLDGLESGGGSDDIDANCEEFNADFASLHEPELGGIDNNFQALIGTVEGALDPAECPGMNTDGCLDGLLRRDAHDGTLLLLLELTGVDSLEHDPEVSVGLYLGRTTDGGPPTTSGPVGERETRVLANQTFETVRTVVEPAPGDILHHRLRVRWPLVDLPRERFGYPTPLGAVELRAGVCANGLFGGHMGGVTSVDDLVAQIAERFSEADTRLARAVAEVLADIRPGADPTVCELVSTAYAIEGVPAVRLP